MPIIGAPGDVARVFQSEPTERTTPPATGFERVLNDRQQVDGSRASSRAERVEPTRTPLSAGEAARALAQAWENVEGEPPSPDTLAILTAQWSHETDRGRAMFNFNFGGIKGTSAQGLTTSLRTHEGFGENRRQIVDNFRAYSTATDGAADYISLLRRRYPEAVGAAKVGDAASFVGALKRRGYFTGDEVAYTRSVTRLASQAVAHGFEALGAKTTDGVTPNLEHFRASQPTTSDFLATPSAGRPLLANRTPVVERVDVIALADEISRVALTIANDSSPRSSSKESSDES